MSQPAELDFEVQRNEDFGPFAFNLIAALEGDAVNLRAWTFTLSIDFHAGRSGSPALLISNFPSAAGSYVQVTDPDKGELEIAVSRVDLQGLPGAGPDDVAMFHNLIGSDETGYERVIARGKFIVEAGV